MNKVVCVNDVSVGELIDVLNSDKNIVVRTPYPYVLRPTQLTR